MELGVLAQIREEFGVTLSTVGILAQRTLAQVAHEIDRSDEVQG